MNSKDHLAKNFIAGFILVGLSTIGMCSLGTSLCSAVYKHTDYSVNNFQKFLASRIQENNGQINCKNHSLDENFSICTYSERKLDGLSCSYDAKITEIDVCDVLLTKKIKASCPNSKLGDCTEIADPLIQIPSTDQVKQTWNQLFE